MDERDRAGAQNARSRRRSAGSDDAAGNDLFRLAVEAAPNAMVMVDAMGRIAMVNGQAETSFGYTRAEMLGQSVEMLVPVRVRDGHSALRKGFGRNPSTRPMGAGRDLFAVRKDGSEFPVEIGLRPVETGDGMMILSAIVDISERKRAEEALRDSQQRARSLAAIVESSDDAIIGSTLDGVVTSWNAAAERMFGYSATEMIGQPVFRLAARDRDAEMHEILDRIASGARIEHYETVRRHKDGAVLQVSLTVSPVYDADGRLIGASKVARDITAAKAADAALRASEAQLQETQNQLIHMSRLTEMGQMATMVAHELNQPLTAINNYLEAGAALLDRDGNIDADRLRAVLRRAAEQSLRAGHIIQRLRSFLSRRDTEKSVELVSPLVVEAAELARVGIRQRDVTIDVRADLPGVSILADKIQIQQVLLNLIRNAAEAVAGQDTRQIGLSAAATSDNVLISVSDNGPGLPEEVRSRLFQPFISTKQTGMGVGLSICNTIVTSHNGRLWVDSHPDGGAVFWVELPRGGSF